MADDGRRRGSLAERLSLGEPNRPEMEIACWSHKIHTYNRLRRLMSTSRSLRQPSAARANSVKSRSDLQIASSRRARPAPAQLMHASRERLRLARTRRRRGRALADGLSLVARRARRAGHRVTSCPRPFGRTRGLREPPRLAMPSTQTRPMARPQQGTQRFTRHHRVTMVSSDVTREHRNGTRAAVAKCVGGAFRCCTRGTERARSRR